MKNRWWLLAVLAMLTGCAGTSLDGSSQECFRGPAVVVSDKYNLALGNFGRACFHYDEPSPTSGVALSPEA